MDTTGYIALSRAISLDRQMTGVATNIANADTSGYRAEHTEFETVLERAGEPRTLAFVQDRGLIRDMTPGAFKETGNELDLAINGDAYFAVQTPQGARYTRAGHFSLDAQGRIVTSGGDPLLGDDQAPISLPENPGQVAIAGDGTISTRQGIIGRVGLARFDHPETMTREGSSLYASGETPRPAKTSIIVQGSVEGSNVQPVREITLMIDTQRAFEGAMRLVETHHDLALKAIDKLANVQA